MGVKKFSTSIKNVLSIDVEQWHHRPVLTKYLNRDIINDKETFVQNIEKILKTFEKVNKKTTFFILGSDAKKIPAIVEKIAEAGHEIGYHGYSHSKLSKLGPDNFKRELRKGKKIIEQITKKKIVGYRSPMFSLNANTSWALPILIENGFKYDSSIYPSYNPYYGSSRAPQEIYRPSLKDPTKVDTYQKKILEFPILTRKFFSFNIPSGGGFYLRLFGSKHLINSFTSHNIRGYSAMSYIHPWEIFGFPKIELPFPIRQYAYFRIPCFLQFKKIVETINIAPAFKIIQEWTM